MSGDLRKLIQVLPDEVEKIWKTGHFHVLTIISLVFQLILIPGNRRRYYSRRRNRIPFWIAYSLRYSVGITALGIITQTALAGCSFSKTNELMSFWASFIFLHVCGPDTIVAYSLEDNELWLTRMGELMIPTAEALYILLLSWPGCSPLPKLSVLVHVAGFIKCFERVQALRSANTNNLQNSMSDPSDPCLVVDSAYREGQCKTSMEAYNLFQTLKPLFVDFPCDVRCKCILYFRQIDSPSEAFHLVETALGFAYDVNFTKASSPYTINGLMLHATSVSLLFSVQAGFYFLCDMDDYNTIDVTITCLLFAEVILKEVYAAITVLQSDWTDLFLSKHNLTRNILIFPFLKKPSTQRWSNNIAQIDLISVALNEMTPRIIPILDYFGLDFYFEKHGHKTYIKLPDQVKNLIHEQLKESVHHSSDPKALCIHKGSFSLENNGCGALLWSIDKAEIDKSILTWHLATKLCGSEVQDDDCIKILSTASKLIFNYMVNLLVSKPDLMPKGFGITRFRNTCAGLKIFFKEEGSITEGDACRKLLAFGWNEVCDSMMEGDRCKSVLVDGCTLAMALRKMEKERMWKVISQVSIEMLANVAVQCTGFQHRQQLRKGGEFLTHVWLMMAALGICKDT